MSTISHPRESRQERVSFAFLHHEAGRHARASNAAAGLAARRLAAGDVDGAYGARVLAAMHRSLITACRARVREAVVDALAGEELEARYGHREVLA